MSYLLFTLAAALQTVRPAGDSMEVVCFVEICNSLEYHNSKVLRKTDT